MLHGIHSTKYEEFLFWTLSICSSTSLADMRPRNMQAQVRYRPWRGSAAAIMFLASNICWVSSGTVRARYCCEPRDVSGEKPIMKKWRRGKGIMLTASLRRSQFSWPGKRRQQVVADMTAATRWLRSPNVGVVSFRVRKQMSYRASLSISIDSSEFSTSWWTESTQLYGSTTVSDTLGEGKTEYEHMTRSGYSSRILEMSRVPMPEPVPPPSEWVMVKPWRQSQPLAQLLPAPDWPKTKLSGRKIWPKGPERTESMVPGSRSIRMLRGTYRPPVASLKYTLMRSSCRSESPWYVPVGSMPCSSLMTSQNLEPIWLPHWPPWTWTISRIVKKLKLVVLLSIARPWAGGESD